jgi:DNA polymerase-3 subunit beta
MKFTCIQKDINHALAVVSGIVPTHHALPVLQCVRLQLHKNTLTIQGTNIEIGITYTLAVEGATDGTVAIPARVLIQTLNTIPSHTTINCFMEEGVFCIKTPHGTSRIHSVDHKDFPSIPEVSPDSSITIPKELFIVGLKNVAFSASRSLVKPELSGVFVYTDDAELCFVASDSFRLAEKKIGIPHETELPDVIIPYEVVQRVVPVLEHIEEHNVTFSFEESQVSCTGGGVYVTFRVIDGTFPDYRAIIPKNTSTTVRILTEDLKKAFKKASLFSDTFSQVGIHVVPSKHTLTLSARNSTVGESIDSYDADIVGDELDINFNHRYVSEGLQTIQSESTTLLFNGPGKPLVIRATDDTSFTYLVMPMNR